VEIFEIWPAALLLAAILLGLVVGSFLNVLVFRLPIMMEESWRRQLDELQEHDFKLAPHVPGKAYSLWWPPSACPTCGQRIAAHHNIPVLSFLWLRGRCASCGSRVSARYPLVEASAALAGVIVVWHFGPTWAAVAALGFTWALMGLSLIDLDHKLLPDSLTLPLMWAGLVLSAFPEASMTRAPSAGASIVGAVAGYLSLWTVYQLFKLATGKEGMGYGDFKLLAAIGAWLGWQLLPLVILLSAAVGSVVGLAMILIGGRSRQAAIPFGPYLAAAGWLAMLYGNEILDRYLSLMR
jgi:leader peptidase (prepilin peptidase) / N-methyltransferase